ncbi:hypothetical protein BBK36DRAFT_1123641 [Trichoderma citrinoviride]|uniref:GPI anchored protein n=1 Tax=Trichoderma citrinoviride TaxID=58853 RepID=A0A2T4B5S1_9HYPO|nr:hypothetical protein BBK36DRAFT_1123641 [Trichoderma citrinoviride]PTB64579.1 hypothetical protein BBK36DRAFT_1123641 [Trichoderma citrinoviride]
MPVYSALLLAAAGFAAADKLAAMNIGEATLHNVTVAGPGAASFGVHSLSDGCGIGMTTCDVNNCMPLTGVCCGLGNGAYCDIGYACVDNGCCPVGKVCNGPPTGCEGDRDLCGEFCVPKGTCDGSGGGGSGGSGGSGGCPSGYEACDDECMPAGSVCCHNGYHCDAGQTCTSDFKCRLGGSSGGGGGSGGGSSSGGGDGGDDGPTSSIDDSFTSRGSGSGPLPTTYSLSPDPEPTAAPTESNPFGGGDDVFTSTEDSSQPTPTNKASTTPRPTSNGSSGSGSGGSSSNGGSNDDDDGSSGTMNAPSLIVGLLAFIPFVL